MQDGYINSNGITGSYVVLLSRKPVYIYRKKLLKMISCIWAKIWLTQLTALAPGSNPTPDFFSVSLFRFYFSFKLFNICESRLQLVLGLV